MERGRSRRLREPASIPSPKSLIFTCLPFICILQPIHEHNLFNKKPHFLPPYQHLSAQREGFPFCGRPTKSPHSWGSRTWGSSISWFIANPDAPSLNRSDGSPFPLYFHCPCFYHLRCGLPSLYQFLCLECLAPLSSISKPLPDSPCCKRTSELRAEAPHCIRSKLCCLAFTTSSVLVFWKWQTRFYTVRAFHKSGVKACTALHLIPLHVRSHAEQCKCDGW